MRKIDIQKEEKVFPICPSCGNSSFPAFKIESNFIFASLLFNLKCSNPKCKEETKKYHCLDSAIEEWEKRNRKGEEK